MANSSKRYYWLKLKRDFFKRHDIKILESFENGDKYLLVYLKLLAESIDHEGRLRFSEKQPYTAKTLSVVIGADEELIKGAIDVLTSLELISTEADGTIVMADIDSLIGSEAWSTERSRKSREKNDATPLQHDATNCNKNATPLQHDATNCNEEKEIEKEIEIELEGKKKKKKAKSSSNPFLNAL